MLTGKACSGHVRYAVLLSGQRGLDYSACDRFCGRIKVGLCIRRYYTNLCYPSNLKDAVCLIGISVNNNGAAGLEQPPPFCSYRLVHAYDCLITTPVIPSLSLCGSQMTTAVGAK